MKMIREAAEILRKIKGTPAEIGRAWIVADELEALLKQEPIAGAFVGRGGVTVRPTQALVSFAETGAYVTNMNLYAAPRPPCDLKAMAEDVVKECLQVHRTSEVFKVESDMLNIDIDAIIQKHTGVDYELR